MRWIDVIWGAFTIAASIGGSWLIAKRTVNAQRASKAHLAAVNQLLPALASLRSLLHRSSAATVQPEDVSTAVNELETVCMQHEVALPAQRTVRREVRAAVGNYFGGVSLAALDARMTDHPLSDPDPSWRAVSLSYIEYVMGVLTASLSGPSGFSRRPRVAFTVPPQRSNHT